MHLSDIIDVYEQKLSALAVSQKKPVARVDFVTMTTRAGLVGLCLEPRVYALLLLKKKKNCK